MALALHPHVCQDSLQGTGRGEGPSGGGRGWGSGWGEAAELENGLLSCIFSVLSTCCILGWAGELCWGLEDPVPVLGALGVEGGETLQRALLGEAGGSDGMGASRAALHPRRNGEGGCGEGTWRRGRHVPHVLALLLRKGVCVYISSWVRVSGPHAVVTPACLAAP